jgi:tetratricopeptide (TPR) repeat protein
MVETLEQILAHEALPPARLVAGYREHVSGACLALARANARLGNETEARKYFDRCLELRRKLVEADATSAYAKQELARALSALGDLEIEQGRTPAALAKYKEAQGVFAALARKDPGNPEVQWYLANTRYSLATAQRLLGDPKGAEQLYRACLKTRETLLKDDPPGPSANPDATYRPAARRRDGAAHGPLRRESSPPTRRLKPEAQARKQPQSWVNRIIGWPLCRRHSARVES